MALTTDRDTRWRDGEFFEFPVAASTTIFAGGLVAINDSELSVPGAADATLRIVGRAEDRADNSTGADGDISVRVRRGCFPYVNSDSITLADIGKPAYAVDDETVAKSDDTGARPQAGIIRDVDEYGVWIEI